MAVRTFFYAPACMSFLVKRGIRYLPPIHFQIKKRPWQWTGLALRTDRDAVEKQALRRNHQGQWKRGRPGEEQLRPKAGKQGKTEEEKELWLPILSVNDVFKSPMDCQRETGNKYSQVRRWGGHGYHIITIFCNNGCIGQTLLEYSHYRRYSQDPNSFRLCLLTYVKLWVTRVRERCVWR